MLFVVVCSNSKFDGSSLRGLGYRASGQRINLYSMIGGKSNLDARTNFINDVIGDMKEVNINYILEVKPTEHQATATSSKKNIGLL